VRVGERFRWVSRVNDLTGRVLLWTEVEILEGILRVQGEAALDLGDLRKVTFRKTGAGTEANQSFNRQTAALILEDGTRSLRLDGSLDGTVEGDPFALVVARVLMASATSCPELKIRAISHGRVAFGIMGVAMLAGGLYGMVEAGRGDSGTWGIAAVAFCFVGIGAVFVVLALRRPPPIADLATLARQLEARARDRSASGDGLPFHVTAARM
jgi:hypothetical protein